MTSTPPPDERPAGEASTEEVRAAESPAPAAEAAPPPAAEAAPYGRPPLPPPPGYPPHPYPFAPVARMPLVNPQRRGTAIGIAAAAGFVALLIGFGIGFAVAPSHDGRGNRIERGYYPQDRGRMGMMPGNRQFPNGRLPNGQFPGGLPNQPSSSAAPTSPSGTPTS